MDLGAIAEAKLANELESLYLGIYRDKYGVGAHIEDQDRNVFNWLSTNFTKTRTLQIVEAYFKCTDPFINRKYHPVKMIRSEINQILPLIKDKVDPRNNNKIVLKVHISCDCCFKYFDLICTPEQLDKGARICEACKTKNS